MKCYPCMKHPPKPSDTQDNWKQFFWENILQTGIHEHTFTCKKPPSGRHRCRGAFPAGLSQSTQPLLLETSPEEEGNSLSDITPTVSTATIPQLPSRYSRNCQEQPIPPQDDRLIVWELRRSRLRELPYPNELKTACDKAKLLDDEDNEDVVLSASADLAKAKEFCMATLVRALEEDTNTDGCIALQNKFGPSVKAWLESLEPTVVLELYQELNDQLPNRNG